MKYLNFLWAALLLFAFAACSDDDEPVTPPGEENIASQFDPKFAAKLLLRGYIDDVRHITRAEVDTITVLDVSGNPSGIEEDFEMEKGLTSLKGIEFFTALTHLNCSYNPLTTLDVSRNTTLKELICNNASLLSLDVSGNAALEYLQCENNSLASLDVSGNTALTMLRCANNHLTSFDVSGNTALIWLDCKNNRLSSLTLGQSNLEKLLCFENKLTALDVSGCPALVFIMCNSNRITSLDLSQNTALIYLICNDNPGRDGIFEVTLWPGSSLDVFGDSWEYKGQTVTVKYTGNEK